MTALFSLSVAALMVLACGGLAVYARHSAERNARTVLNAAAAQLAQEIGKGDEDEQASAVIEDEREDLQPSNLAFFVVAGDGHLRWTSMKKPPKQAPGDGREWRTARLPVNRDTLVIALPWADTESSLTSLTRSLSLLGLFVVALATVGAWVLVGRTLSPIGRLSRQAKAATADNLQVRLDAPSRDAEIVGLVETLNGLLSRLSETAAAKGRFCSAASHELRTPLQALSGHLELALARDRTQEEYRAAVEEAHRQTQRLTKLTKNLLMLYQLDSADAVQPDEPGDLAAICRDCINQFDPLARERRLRMSASLPESAPFSAPVTHAEALVRNLIENAVRYATDGSEVRVDLTVLSNGVELTVFNECAFPADWEAEKLLEPFSRPDASRTASTGGTGLGLTICRSIADANGWLLQLTTVPEAIQARLVIPQSSGS